MELSSIKLANAERFLRELSSLPLTLSTIAKGEFELMKKISKDILRGWADRRRKNMVYEELMNEELNCKKKPLSKISTGDIESSFGSE